MKIFLISVFMLLLVSNTNSQTADIKGGDSCSLCFHKQFSYYWKMDSMAHNGFRLMAYSLLLNCKNTKVNEAQLIEKLGVPNIITTDNLGSKYFKYYYVDGFTMPNENYIPRERAYIFFRFDKKHPYVSYVGEGHYD